MRCQGLDFRSDRLFEKGLLDFDSFFMQANANRHTVAVPEPKTALRIGVAFVERAIVVYVQFIGGHLEVRKDLIGIMGGDFLRWVRHGLFITFSIIHFRFPFLVQQAKAFIPPVLRS